jgi:hypothetical protein
MPRVDARVWFLPLCVSLRASTVLASPNAALDNPIYEQLARLRALGQLPAYSGGVRPLTQTRIRELVGARDAEPSRAFWFAPFERVFVRIAHIGEAPRAYSTPVRPRSVTGAVSLSCEHLEGSPCGDGTSLVSELDSSAGYRTWLAGSIRLRATLGTNDYDNELALARGYLNSELGPVVVEVGRDVLTLGPSSRTQLGWGDNAPPLDHIRISTTRPVALTRQIRGSAFYAVGRLAAPQRYPNNLVSISRVQADIADTVEIGASQLLQLGGDGAPHIGVLDFVLEHVRRRDISGGPTDSSNRRVGLDVASRIGGLWGARVYYELVFEDLRRARFIDAFRYDADHQLGIDFSAIGPRRDHGLLIEWHKTGVRSQEHSARTTGFTNAGRVVGSPLGPDAESIFVRAKVPARTAMVYPWLEAIRISSDTYTFVEYGPISPVTRGVTEYRGRLGASARIPVSSWWSIRADAAVETVHSAGFEAGRNETNYELSAALIWQPIRT